ncbi:MAG: DUF4129 domain-containing protein [Arenicella sp.]|nr:DUF4129 domain-containing protein [Arenicella sp.]
MMFRQIAFIVSVVSALLTSAMVLAQQDQPTVDQQSQDSYESDEIDESDYVDEPNFTLESGRSLPRSETSKRYHAEIEKVLAGVDFAQRKEITARRLKDVTNKETREEKFPRWIIDFVKAIEASSGGVAVLATILEVLVWILFIGLIIFFLVKYRSQLQDLVVNIGAKEKKVELPASLFGLDIQKDSIPDDVVAEAQQHWSKGDKRLALATLLRASLIKLLHEHGCRFFSSDTEAECADRIEQQARQDISDYMRVLVAVWQRVAYAHLDPSENEFRQLCSQWPEVFR